MQFFFGNAVFELISQSYILHTYQYSYITTNKYQMLPNIMCIRPWIRSKTFINKTFRKLYKKKKNNNTEKQIINKQTNLYLISAGYLNRIEKKCCPTKQRGGKQK